MANETKVAYIAVPDSAWWALRRKLGQTMPKEIAPSYLASVLNIGLGSTRNVLPGLRAVGLIDDTGKPTELANRWRNDAEYRQVCHDSARKWRSNHPGYWKQYRAAKPDAVERNRTQQQQRDLRQRLADVANNNSALDLKSSAAGVWLLGPVAKDLANNNLAATQVVILQGSLRQPPLRETSCKQHPSGLPSAQA